MLFPYKETIETSMKQFYRSLCERDRRRYAAIETKKLPYGGLNYMSNLLECDPKSIRRGQSELRSLELDTTRIRKMGGGRKKSVQNQSSAG